MKRTLLIILCATCACMYCLPAFGWGQKGHRIIAQIAYDNLSGKARKQVDAITGKKGIIYWSNWPDEIKSDTIYPQSIKDGWHYQDLAGGMSDEAVADALIHYPKEGGKLFRALDSIELVLRNDVRFAKEANEHTLRFFIHLSGDRYCPMQMAHMDDKGGNAVRMAWFSKNTNTNLHSVWDSKLIESQGYSYSEYAEMIELRYADHKKRIEQASDKELLINSYHLTEAIYAYQTTWDGNTYHYIYKWHEPMELQLYIAGIRLAKKLNQLYK